MSPNSPDRGGDAPPKTTLFCPTCGHRSPVDGDWTRRASGRETRYVCPDCRAEVTRRPGSHGTTDRGLWQAWTAGVQAWQTIWQRVLRP